MGMPTAGFKSASQIHSNSQHLEFIRRKQHAIKVKQCSSKALFKHTFVTRFKVW